MGFWKWGYVPLITSDGNCSTSMSGATPTFSTINPSLIQMPTLGAVTPPPSKNSGKPKIPTSPPQVRVPTRVPTLNFRNIQGSISPPEPADSLISNTLGPWKGAVGDVIAVP